MHMPVAGMVVVLDGGKGDVDVKPLLKGEHCLLGYLPEVEVFEGILLFSIRAYNDPEKDRPPFCLINHLVGVIFCYFSVYCIKRPRRYPTVFPGTVGDVAD